VNDQKIRFYNPARVYRKLRLAQHISQGGIVHYGRSWQWKWPGVIAGLILMVASAAWAQVDTMASIKQKGKIVVGVKADYKPFGYTDPSGKIVGLEIDLANDIAKRLGVQIELVPVVAANRMEFVKQGRTDLMIATMAYKPDRAEVVAIPQPFYYAGAANVFAKKNSGLKAWADLKGKPVCAIQGAYYNRKTGEEFGAQLVVFKGVTEAMAALEGGNCVGTVFDTTFFAGIMGDAKWADYAMVLPSIDPEPWGLAVRKEDTKFAAWISDVSKEWHKTGFILGLEKKWGIPQSPFLVEQQTKFK
jgi:polar amino acid transport system substrate-binding protein